MKANPSLLIVPMLWLVDSVAMASSEGGGSEVPHSVPTSVWFHAINLAILVFLLYRWLRIPLRDYLVHRSDSVREALEQAQTMKQQAEKLKAEYGDRIARLDSEMSKMQEEMEEFARDEAATIVESARKMAKKIEQDTERLLNDELSRARYALRQEAIGLAMQFARENISAAVNQGDQQRLVERFLQSLPQSTEIN